ncbi:MAG: mechanosensitive ion channel [Planctomycetes bacterium]|nr:mechanosensitive ion channel [Planctomycetota bacterium]
MTSSTRIRATLLTLLIPIVAAVVPLRRAGAQGSSPEAAPTRPDSPTLPAVQADTPWMIPAWQVSTNVRPLTLEEVRAELDRWRDALKGAAAAVGDAELARKPAAEIQELKDRRAEVALRFDAIVASFRAKGGPDDEADRFEKYRAAVVAEGFPSGDVSEIGAVAMAWLLSPTGGLLWAKNLIFFVLTLIAFKILASVAGRITAKAVSRMKKSSELLRDFFVNTVRKTVSIVGLVIALSMLGINVGPFVAAIGAVGFVVGFALQGTLSNFAAGVMILLYRPYDIGNFVTAAGVSGTVSSMNLVSTTLTTPDNQTVVVPNGSIWGDVITNTTGSETRRVDLKFGVGYGDDLSQAQAILERVVKNHELTLDEPAPVIRVHELGDSSVNFIVRPWVKTKQYWDVYWDITRRVKEEFDREGISIPFPQRDVHLHPVPE